MKGITHALICKHFGVILSALWYHDTASPKGVRGISYKWKDKTTFNGSLGIPQTLLTLMNDPEALQIQAGNLEWPWPFRGEILILDLFLFRNQQGVALHVGDVIAERL